MDLNYKQFPKDRALRHSLCRKSASWFEGQASGLKYVHILACNDRLCPTCGNKGGYIHKRRVRRFLDGVKKAYGSIDGLGLRKFVFTLPADLRDSMQNRKALNGYFLSVEKVMKPLFPGRMIFLSSHLFGDRDLDFKPHINAYVVERLDIAGGVKMKLDSDFLSKVKNDYVLALVKLGYDVVMADVHYSFTLDRARFLHGIRYLTRPSPDQKMLVALGSVNPGLYDFLLSEEMKGFQFVRVLRVKVDRNQYVQGVSVIKFEKMKFLETKKFVWASFTDFYRVHERIEVFPGLYACRSGGLSLADYDRFKGAEDG